MTRQEIKDRVMECASVIYKLYPSNYNSDVDNYVLAEDLWLTRTPSEYKEDKQAGVTKEDYRIWISEQYNIFKDER